MNKMDKNINKFIKLIQDNLIVDPSFNSSSYKW